MSNTVESSFSTALRDLEAIVVSLERGDTPLEELILKYEEGVKLHARCQKILREVELRVEQLRPAGDKAAFVLLPDAGASD
ncbi:MAG: exodeoxyribonuclease VII small subunit [Puniceicoccales bacterium]|jgi:exodeoxyribonuclease VII small subunit|nr:exodeoxyribonuclease VII small subunit [Puniceicoccales bacterium]